MQLLKIIVQNSASNQDGVTDGLLFYLKYQKKWTKYMKQQFSGHETSGNKGW